MSQRQEATIEVPREDLNEEQRKAKEEKEKVPLSQRPHNENPAGIEEAHDGLTEEDRELRDKLHGLVAGVLGRSEEGKSFESISALKEMCREIQTSTSSMTSVPKPLKFLRQFYDDLKGHFASSKDQERALTSDILSALAMTKPEEEHGPLYYRLAGTRGPIGTWGHEYVRSIAGELGKAFQDAEREDQGLLSLVREIIEYDFKHNSEAEACDLLLEVDRLEWLLEFSIDPDNVSRVCEYLIAFGNYVADHEELEKVLGIAFDMYIKNGELPDALRVALRLDDMAKVSHLFAEAEKLDSPFVKKQLGFILAAQKQILPEYTEDEEMMEIIGNGKLHEHFVTLAHDLEVLEPKAPEDIYKSHLADPSRLRRQVGGKVDNAKENLASTFVNAFVNCGFGTDLLMTPDKSDWIHKNKEDAKLSVIASLGLICLWDVENGFEAVDKYTVQDQKYYRPGSLLATGLVSSGVTSEMDAAFALLSEHLEEGSERDARLMSILGLATAYAGSARDDLLEGLSEFVSVDDYSFDTAGIAALALGFIFCGQCSDEVSGSILDILMSTEEEAFTKKENKAGVMYMTIGLGLLYLGRGEACEAILEALKVIEHPAGLECATMVEVCAYAGSGNVLTLQKLLAIIRDHYEEEASEEKTEEKEEEQEDPKMRLKGVAVLGIAALAIGESLGSQMCLRTLDNVLQYCDMGARRAVPLALALVNVSNPNIVVMETLSKLSHDADEYVSMNATCALGFIGAGTNNSRVAQILRDLAVYYAKEPNHLFFVRIAQGLLHMGKGLLSLAPFHSDGLLMSNVSMCGLLTVLTSFLESKATFLSSMHYMLYALTPSIRTRTLITLDENLELLPVPVRVGQRVDTVGQAGNPKRITGFQTHTTPVLLGHGERAELANDEYIPYSRVLEGCVILRKNPDAEMD